MSLSYTWVGATTPAAVIVKARLSGDTARLHVSTESDLADPVKSEAVAPENGVAELKVDGLKAATRYYYGVEIDGDLDREALGRFRTHPVLGEPADFTVAATSCAGFEPEHPGTGDVTVPARVSNHPVFSDIRERDPLMLLHMGDIHYYDIGSGEFVPDHDVDTYRGAFDDVFAQPRQAGLYRDVATQYVWDDHDFGPNNSDGTAPGRKAAAQVYRERVPHYELSDEVGIWHSWTIGRVLFVALDVRSYRSPDDDPDGPDKTMLGAAQKAWLKGVLESSDAAFLVLLPVCRWFDSSSNDTWSSFAEERSQLIDMFDSLGWAGRMCLVVGDLHAVAMDSGGNSPGRVPVFHFASMDSRPSVVNNHYDLGPSLPGRGQYGLLRLNDTGAEITVTATGYQGAEKIKSHSFTVGVSGTGHTCTPEEEMKEKRAKTEATSRPSLWTRLKQTVRGLFYNS
ncbi:alkaline phosphatase D family protein [Stackebrandtia nassauensis]|uniref:Phosphodiesterase/alkaline phosphatase D-like protein n=1 Tax=Stackebrandtia nassauensis (strain DSM 44728 / CIP 108903 / NRRL B-16338 / NBRC 102104 / LLR-40K-21) TaxID=446470 RepID=D3Q581_STANL|nr:alkaline phosphatase D family protein [Stackebrandtia nassauensis]ADD44130.1 Phosphodiesterase/alkaline phosphatase D-like protein [Stackebrandtia nassauensis DSM 44728]